MASFPIDFPYFQRAGLAGRLLLLPSHQPPRLAIKKERMLLFGRMCCGKNKVVPFWLSAFVETFFFVLWLECFNVKAAKACFVDGVLLAVGHLGIQMP